MDSQVSNQGPVYVVKQITPETEGAATTSLWLEIIFGLFSLLGIGHVYSGRTVLGIALMIGWWVYIFVAGVLSTVTLGLGACVFVPIYIAVPIISGIQARTYMHKTGEKGHWGAVAIVAGAGIILTILFLAVIGLGIFAIFATQRSSY
jgi:hypothetical protein